MKELDLPRKRGLHAEMLYFMKAYLEGIYLFKTNEELALSTPRKYARLSDTPMTQVAYDEYAQRLIRSVSYPSSEGTQTILNQLAKSRPTLSGYGLLSASLKQLGGLIYETRLHP